MSGECRVQSPVRVQLGCPCWNCPQQRSPTWAQSSEVLQMEQISACFNKIIFPLGLVRVKLLSTLENDRKNIILRFQNCVKWVWKKDLLWWVGRSEGIFALRVKIQGSLHYELLLHMDFTDMGMQLPHCIHIWSSSGGTANKNEYGNLSLYLSC